MANCEEIKDKESQAYKDCLAKEASDTAKAAGVEDLGAKPEILSSVSVEGNVNKNSLSRDAFAIKLGTILVDEVTTRNTENSWNQVAANMFDIKDSENVSIDEKYSKYKKGALGQMANEAPDLYEEFQAIRLNVKNSGKYDNVGGIDEKNKKIRKDARKQFNEILDLKTETELRNNVGDKVYEIYKAANFDPLKVTEASLLDPETFDEEEIKANEILINKGLNKFKQRRAESIVGKFRKDNNISGLGLNKNKELNYQEIIRGVEAWFYEGDDSSSVFYPNQKILVENIEKAKENARAGGGFSSEPGYEADEIRKMRNATPKQLKAAGYQVYQTPESISNDLGTALKVYDNARLQVEKDANNLNKRSGALNKKIDEAVLERKNYLDFYSDENKSLIEGLGLEYDSNIANEQLNVFNEKINGLIDDFNGRGFNEEVIAINLRNDQLNKTAKILKEKALKFDDFAAIMGAAQLNHNLIDKTFANIERDYILAPYTLLTQGTALGYELFQDKETADLIRTAGMDYYKLMQDRQGEFVKPPTIDEVKNDDDFFFSAGTMFKSWTADAALTISAVLGPGKVAKLISSGAIKNLTKFKLKGRTAKLVASDITKANALTAQRTTMGLFFTSSAGGQLGSSEFTRSIADKQILKIEELLKDKSLPFTERQNLLGQLDEFTDSKNNSRAFRIFNSIGYGFVEMYAEKLGTLRYMNDFNAARTVAERAGKLSLWQKGLYGARSTLKGVGTELVEESVTNISHVALDNFGRKNKISVFTGLDKDFAANIAYTSLLLQGPSKVTNIWNTLKQEITTSKDRKETEKIFGKLYDIQTDLDLELKKPGSFTKQELKDKKNERKNLFQMGSINEFLSMQKWTKMSQLERDNLIDLGGKLKTKEAAYVEFINDPAFGLEGFQQQVEQFEKEINDLREQQGELLQSKAFKEYQKWQTLDIEAGNANVDVEGLGSGTGIKVSAVVAAGRIKVFEAANDILKHQFSGTTTSIEADNTGENLQNFITEYNERNKDKVDKEGNKIEPLTVEEIENSYAGVLPDGNVYINKGNIFRGLQNGTTSDALIAAIAPLHELIHLQIAKKNIFGKSPALNKKAEIASLGLIDIIDDKVNKEQLTQEQAKEIKDRIDSYKKDGELNYEEILTIFGESIVLGNIKQSDFAGLAGMKEFLNGMFSMMNPGGASEILNPFNSGNDMYNFLSNFVEKQADVSTRVSTADTEKEQKGPIKPSLVPGDLKSKFDDIVQNEDGTRKFENKEDFDASIEKDNIQVLIETTNTLDASIRNLPGVSQAYLDLNPEFVEDVKRRISDKAMSEFNPGKNESFFGWMTGKNVSGKSIIELAAGDIQIRNKKEIDTSSIDASTRQVADQKTNTTTKPEVTPIIDVMKFAKKANPAINVETVSKDFQDEIQSLAKQKNIDITKDNLTNKELMAVTPYGVLADIVGIDVKKLQNPNQNLDKPDSLKAQKLLLAARPFIKNVVLGQSSKKTQKVDILRDGKTVEDSKTKKPKQTTVGGETLNLGRNIQKIFFNPPKRVGNNYVRTPKKFDNKVYDQSIGTKDGKVDPNYVPRASESQVIKALLKSVAEQMANRSLSAVLDIKEAKGEITTPVAAAARVNLKRGTSDLVFSNMPSKLLNTQLQTFSEALRTVDLNKILRKAGVTLEKQEYPSSDQSIATRANSGKYFDIVKDKKGKTINGEFYAFGEYFIDDKATNEELMSMYISEDTIFVKDDKFLDLSGKWMKKIAPFLNPSILEASLLAGGPRSMFGTLDDVYKALGVETKAEAIKLFNDKAPISPVNFDYSRGKFAKMSRKEFREYTKTDEFKDNEALKMPFLKDFANVMAKTMKNDPGARAMWAGFLGATSNMSKGVIRRMAPIKFWSLIDQKKGNLFVEEHSMPANNIAKLMFYIADNNSVKENFSFIEDNYFQGQLRKLDDNKLKASWFNYIAKMPKEFFTMKNLTTWIRYNNEDVASVDGGIDFSSYEMIGTGNTIAEQLAIQAMDIVTTHIEVQNVLDKGRKSKIKASKPTNPKILNTQFNKIIEQTLGVDAKKIFSDIVAKRRGAKKGKFRPFVPPSMEDFQGLMYDLYTRGTLGEQQMAWVKKNLIDPYQKGVASIDVYRQTLKQDYKALLKKFPNVKKNLGKIIPGTDFTQDQAIRVSLWTKAGYEIPGISKRDAKKLNDFVDKNPELGLFGEGALLVSKQKNWAKPDPYWDVQSILSDLNNFTNNVGRQQYLEEFNANADAIFSKENLNKLEASLGSNWRSAMEDSLYRMRTGTNRPSGADKLTNAFLNWTNNSIGAIMFFNRKSALLQTISSVNFLNWSDNNPVKAAMAFANFPQFVKDFAFLWNSPKLKQRRSGLRSDVNEAEIANAVRGATNKAQAMLSYLLKLGFTPTQLADSFAIASGGATFYRNRLNTYKKDGLTEEEASKKAFEDFSETSEVSQQSADPMFISQQQAGILGRLILAFQNTPAQVTRLFKKASRDFINVRGDQKTNMSKMVYYGAIQGLIFAALQNAIFIGMDEDDEDEDVQRRKDLKQSRILNSMTDTLLRGSGVYGAIVATLKNTINTYYREKNKSAFGKENANVILEALNLSPPIGSKLRKISNALKTEDFQSDQIEKMGWDVTYKGRVVLSPKYNVIASTTEALTNIPLERAMNEFLALSEMMDQRNSTLQRIALALGYRAWDVGAKIEEFDEIKIEAKKDRATAAKERAKLKREEAARIKEAKKYEGKTPEQIVYIKRYEVIMKQRKPEQVKTLSELGLTDKQIKALKYEKDRAKKILELQDKK